MIGRASALHDIGKIVVPDNIILKSSKLNEDEFEVIKSHTTRGAEIIDKLIHIDNEEFCSYAYDIARHHHEKYDGKGYPDGLKGSEIPEMSRIIGVADAYDAMTSNRSYRDVLPQSVVRKEIEKGKGSQFDPVFADMMLQLIDEDTEYLMRES